MTGRSAAIGLLQLRRGLGQHATGALEAALTFVGIYAVVAFGAVRGPEARPDPGARCPGWSSACVVVRDAHRRADRSSAGTRRCSSPRRDGRAARAAAAERRRGSQPGTVGQGGLGRPGRRRAGSERPSRRRPSAPHRPTNNPRRDQGSRASAERRGRRDRHRRRHDRRAQPAVVVDEPAPSVDVSYREFTQHFPRPAGWSTTPSRSGRRSGPRWPTWSAGWPTRPVAAIGITNQRETVVAWDRAHRAGRCTGPSCGRTGARRTAATQLRDAGHLPLVRDRTGLVLDPYFSRHQDGVAPHRAGGGRGRPTDLALGHDRHLGAVEPDRRADGGVYATDPTNASRTMLFDIRERAWSAELCDLFGVPADALPDGAPVERALRRHRATRCGVAGRHPRVAASPATSRPRCSARPASTPGMAKNTYGTGSFVLMNVGADCPPPADGLLTTVAWTLGRRRSTVAYALEGAIFVTGAAVQWLRDGLGIIAAAAEVGPLADVGRPTPAASIVVPAFTGLGSPWWDPYARGTIVGITRGTDARPPGPRRGRGDGLPDPRRGRGHGPRRRPSGAELRVDGGAAAMDLLLQLQADQLGVTVRRPVDQETTALGAAYLAGLAEGVWGSLDDDRRAPGSSTPSSAQPATAPRPTPATRPGCAGSSAPGPGPTADRDRPPTAAAFVRPRTSHGSSRTARRSVTASDAVRRSLAARPARPRRRRRRCGPARRADGAPGPGTGGRSGPGPASGPVRGDRPTPRRPHRGVASVQVAAALEEGDDPGRRRHLAGSGSDRDRRSRAVDDGAPAGRERGPQVLAQLAQAGAGSAASTRAAAASRQRELRVVVVAVDRLHPLDVDALDLGHLPHEQVDRARPRAAPRPARRWPARHPARGSRSR